MGKYTLIVISGLLVSFGWTSGTLNEVNRGFADKVVTQYERAAARQAALSSAEMALAMLADSTEWRTGYANVALGGGTGWVSVVDSTADSSLAYGELRVEAHADGGEASDTVAVIVRVPVVPPTLRGAVTTAASVIHLNMDIDGRDHNYAWALVAGKGMKGVSSTQNINQNPGVDVGGTSGGVDYAPSFPAAPAVLEEFGAFSPPATPDEVFGLPDGTLKARAQSGVNGSQYVTNPASLTFPLSGVTYVEPPGGGTWEYADLGWSPYSTGVLVVHNTAGDAELRNVSSGVFKGLIVADEFSRCDAYILGAVVALSPTPANHCVCTGSGAIVFSREALVKAAAVAAGANGQILVDAWRE